MPLYMLDTDISSYAMKLSNPGVVRRVRELNTSDLCISAITKGELLFGVEVSPRRERDAAALEDYLRYVAALDYPSAAAQDYAIVRANLKRQGKLIGANDLLIASHARHLGLTLVTNNVCEFSRVSGLFFENWAEEN